MALSIGTRLGPYEILSAIGAGGMGEVYRARDTKLSRDVAIKVLPESFAHDAERLARFTREAQTLASLNHPNIAAIYGVEDCPEPHSSAGGSQHVRALVMELVEGDDLSQRLARGAIPLDEALPIAKQIADALEAAHEQGIIHRDLKPANIKVREDGTVKVLDFGLAKLVEAPGAGSSAAGLSQAPTITSPAMMTGIGMLLGTAAYMSPEQARGKVVDKRADIWAFGAMLYEMLTGRRAFAGDNVSETLASVLTDTPDFASVPSSTPPALRRLIERCLERDLRSRLRDIGEARITIARIESAPPDEAVAAPAVVTATRVPAWRRVLPWGVAAALAVVLAASFGRASGVTPLRRFTLSLPSKIAPNWSDFLVDISPDGASITYNSREGNTVSICLRALDSLNARRVAEGRDANDWFFSPDGEWIGIVSNVGLSKVSIRGGQPQIIYRWPGTARQPTGFSWGEDGYILLGTRTGIQRVPASGGVPEAVTHVAEGSGVAAHLWPSRLPDGQSALITIQRTDGGETCGVVHLQDGAVLDLGIRGHGFTYVAPGWLTYQQGTTFFAFRFDPSHPERLSTPVPVVENARSMPRVARDGTLVYVPTRGESTARLVWVDRQGRPTPIGAEHLDFEHLTLAPDGRRAILNLDEGAIELVDLQSGTRKRVAQGSFPIWSSSGDRVTSWGAGGLWSSLANGGAAGDLLVPYDGIIVPTSWNALTGDLAYYDSRSGEIWLRSPDGKTRRFIGGPGSKRSGRFSPDGKWMAFVSDETGDYQVYVIAYPGPGPTVPVSSKGGLSPIWSADGRELFFRLGSKVLSAAMTGTQPPSFGAPAELFDGPYTLDLMGHQHEDVSPDSKSFLMVENSDDFPMVFVQNWPLELERLTRSGGK